MIFSLFENQPYLNWPNHFIGWLGLIAFLAAFVWGIWHTRSGFNQIRARLWLIPALAFVAIFASGLLGFRLPGETLPLPVLPVEAQAPAIMLFSAIPWVLAAGLLGPLPAILPAVMGGFVLAFFETHNPSTPIEMGVLAWLFALAVRQDYRTPLYRILRHPLAAAPLVALAFLPVMMLSSLFSTNGSLAVRLDYAFTQVWITMLARAGELLIAGLVGEILFIAFPLIWKHPASLRPSPSESNIQTRFFLGTVPMVMVLILTLIIGNWLVAGNAAQRMVKDRLASTAEVAANSLPNFLETGQNLIITLATPDLIEMSPQEVDSALLHRIRSVPYFRQLSLFNAKGESISGYPVRDFNALNPTPEEQIGIQLVLKGVTTQNYVIPPLVKETSAQMSFMAVIRDAQGVSQGVLLGRTDFNTNPFTRPALDVMEIMQSMNGEGIILDDSGKVLYHPSPSQVMTQYLGKRTETASFFEELSPRNTRQYVYYQPVVGLQWAIVLSVPAQVAQQIALEIAIPLLVMLVIFAALAFIFLRIGLRAVTSSLLVLAQEASYITRGQLSRPLEVKGVDEVGRLSEAFERMRLSLKSRLDELNQLLIVSQGVAANLDIAEASRPILEAALQIGAVSARVVFVRDVIMEADQDRQVAFGVGPMQADFAYLDSQIFELTRQQDMVSFPSTARMRSLHLEPGRSAPGALVAVAIRQESRYYGVLWVAFERSRSVSEEEIRFISTLAGEAALAAISARLYATAEVGRRRLEAVLASTPEPVLVIDEKNRLLLLNPSAIQVPGLILSADEGQPVQDVVGPQEIINLLIMPLRERISSREVTLQNGKVYYASVAPVSFEEQAVGRVCILRDITHFKEIEQMKSDFVSTVSHDLRSPLTLMRGYSTMLQMVGELNDQQKGYVQKIVVGVENMTRLVNNLLDLGRIDAGIGLQIDRVPVNEIVEEVVNSLQLEASQKTVTLVQDAINFDQSLVIQADRALIRQAIFNIVENAVKYTPAGGEVKVRLAGRAHSIMVEVFDNGIGIAPLDLPHLFEKFYRSGRRESYSQRGTGLGLAIVRSIAERHGGQVYVDSQLGKGSVFSLEIPTEQPKRTVVKSDE